MGGLETTMRTPGRGGVATKFHTDDKYGTPSHAEVGGEGVGRENPLYTFYMETGPLIRTDKLYTTRTLQMRGGVEWRAQWSTLSAPFPPLRNLRDPFPWEH